MSADASPLGRRIALWLDHAENRRLLAEWLQSESPHTPVVPATNPPDTDEAGDLCIVDGRTLSTYGERLDALKADAAPEFYPVLLVHAGDEASLSDDQWDRIDEAIDAPIDLDLFEHRLANLLERRQLSTNLATELERTEQQYQAVFEAANDAILVVDPEHGTIEDANPKACDLLGYSLAELRSLPSVTEIVAGDATQHCAFVTSVIEEGQGSTDELTCVRRDGTELAAEVSASVLEDGDDLRLVASIRNVTKRRAQRRMLTRQRNELDELNRINRALRETTQAVARASDREELERQVCDRLAGSDPYRFAWIGNVDDGTVTPRCAAGIDRAALTDVVKSDEDPVETAIRDGDVSVVQHADDVAVWRDAATRHGFRSAAAVPIRRGGDDYGVLVIHANRADAFADRERSVLADLGETIGDAIEAHRARENAQLFQQAVEHAGNAIYITDADGVIVYVNSAFEELTGYDDEEAVGRDVRMLRADDQSASFYRDLWQTVHANDVLERELVTRGKGGRRQHVDLTVAPLSGEDERIEHLVAVKTDITDQRRRQQQLQVLYRVLRHNLRNELNVIDGYLDAIDGGGAAAQHAKANISDAVSSLLGLSEQAQRVERTFTESNSGPDVDNFATILSRQVDRLRREFPDADVRTTVPDVAYTVDDELETAVAELLTNAARHNDAPTPTVELDADVADGDDGPWATVTVRDDGPGVPKQEREVLSEGEETSILHGSGLGLWLVNWVVTELGGDISISDNDPRGSVVTLTVPLTRP
jgi:PAS domain S-box-containing protein